MAIDPGLATAGAGLLDAAVSVWGAGDQRSSAKHAASNAQAFAERMSATAYQRAVADMKAAGLNPALAYGAGPASSPMGSAAQISSLTEGLGQRVSNSALQVAEMKKIQSETDLNRAMADTNVISRIQSQAQAHAAEALAKKTEAETVPIKIDADLLDKYPWLRQATMLLNRVFGSGSK